MYLQGLLACLPHVCCLVMACVDIPSSPSFSASSTTSSAIFLWLFLRLPTAFNLAWFIWLSASDSPAQLLKGDFMAVGCTPCAPIPGMATPPGSEEPSCVTLVSPISARQRCWFVLKGYLRTTSRVILWCVSCETVYAATAKSVRNARCWSD